MLAEESEPEPPQRVGAVQHHLHQPAGMGAGVEGQRQLHDVLEIIGQHRLALAVRQPVGMERDHRAAGDGEQAERHPGRQQRPRRVRGQRPGLRLAGEHVDDLAEQHRLGELRAGQQQIGEGENPAQPRLLAEQLEDAGVKAQHGHSDQDSKQGKRSAGAILIRDRGGEPERDEFCCGQSVDLIAAQRLCRYRWRSREAASRRMGHGTIGASWFSRRCEASSGDGALRLLTMRRSDFAQLISRPFSGGKNWSSKMSEACGRF